MNKIEIIGTHDKEYGNYSKYLCIPFGLHVNSFSHNNMGFIEEWELTTPFFYYKGRTQQEFFDAIQNVIGMLELDFSKRKAPKNPRSENGKKLKEKAEKNPICEKSKKLVVIYTDNMLKVRGFFKKHMTKDFADLSITLDDFVEIRPCWYKMSDLCDLYEGSDAYKICMWAKDVIENYFIKDKAFYISINQMPRKRIAKLCKQFSGENLFLSWASYQDYHKAQLGGIVYDYAPSKVTIWKNFRVHDADSFYPYQILTKKFPMKYVKKATTLCGDFYIGLFEITVKDEWPSYLSYLKNSKGKKLKSLTERLWLTNIDVQNINDFAKIVNIKVIENYIFDGDYLPDGVLQETVNEYITKTDLKAKKKAGLITKAVLQLQKSCLNGIAGDMQTGINSLEDFKQKKIYRKTPPIWGIFLTAYARYDLLHLATKVENWIKSDTDCIICKNTAKNIKIIEDYNIQANKLVMDFCKRFNQDFNNFYKLGCFELEAIAVKYKCWAKKTYMYIDSENNITFKASGLKVDKKKITPSWLRKTKLPYVKQKRGMISEEKVKYEEYESDGFYYEKDIDDIASLAYMAAANA